MCREVMSVLCCDVVQVLSASFAFISLVCVISQPQSFSLSSQKVLDLGVETGATSLNATPNVGNTIGVILAIIVFVLAFAEALVISGGYVLDVWSGHFLVKKFVFNQLSNVAVDWIFFCFFLLFPLLIMCFSLLARSADWWRITGKDDDSRHDDT